MKAVDYDQCKAVSCSCFLISCRLTMNLSLLLEVSLPEDALQCVLHLFLGDEVGKAIIFMGKAIICKSALTEQ